MLMLLAAMAVWHWDASDRVLSVSHGQPLAPVSFIHLGYTVPLVCSHQVTGPLERFREKGVVIVVQNELQLAAGANSFMVQEPGNYRVVPRAECICFKQHVRVEHPRVAAREGALCRAASQRVRQAYDQS